MEWSYYTSTHYNEYNFEHVCTVEHHKHIIIQYQYTAVVESSTLYTLTTSSNWSCWSQRRGLRRARTCSTCEERWLYSLDVLYTFMCVVTGSVNTVNEIASNMRTVPTKERQIEQIRTNKKQQQRKKATNMDKQGNNNKERRQQTRTNKETTRKQQGKYE